MAEKKGAGGEPQEYNESNGRYGSGGDNKEGSELLNAVKNYKPNDLKSEVYRATSKPLAVEDGRELYDSIQSGKRYSYEELLQFPVIQLLEEKANKAEELAKNKPLMSEQDKKNYSEKFLQGAEKALKQFRADIVMGLPAAGKSTAVVNDLKAKYGSFEFDNDEIKKLLPGYDKYGATYVHKDSKEVQNTAFDKFKRGQNLNGSNLAIPIIGSSADKVNDWIEDLQKAGYTVHVHHVDISNEESINRATARAIRTGRYVPLRTINKYGEKPKEVYERLKRAHQKEVIFE